MHFDLNIQGLLSATKEAVLAMGNRGGSIINISSVAATSATPGASVYSATKGAVNTLTLALAAELGPKQIRVNAISPGMTDTEGFQTAGIGETEMAGQVIAATPLARIGQPEDIAKVVAFIASDAAGWITGEVIDVAGGYR